MTLCVVVMMSFMSCLDASIVNIALPVMREKLNTTMAGIEWVVTAYLMAICATILVFGRLGDLLGKGRVFQWGTVIFTASSLACGLCPNLPALAVCRCLQGIGAAAYMSNNQGIITQSFPQNERGKALGFLASSVALGTMLGPALGGLVIANLSWHWIFFINVPLGIFAFFAGLKVLPKEESRKERFDVPGSAFFAAFVVLAIAGVTFGQTRGFADPAILVALVAAAGSLALFVAREKRTDSPLLDLRVFSNGQFTLALICAFLSFVCINASNILIPFYLQDTRGFNPALAGLIMMVSPLVTTFFAPVSGSLADRIGPQKPSFIGLAFLGAGFVLMTLLGTGTPWFLIVAFLLVMAFGQSLFQPSNNTIIMSSVPKNQLGVAGSVNALARNLGLITGVTLSTTLLYGLMSASAGKSVIDYPAGNDALFVQATGVIYLALALVTFVGAVLTFVRMKAKNLR
jgi:EmrB/QacA subfamily drug resistance transporter